MNKPKVAQRSKLGVVVFVSGGNVQAVYAREKITVEVVDFDNLKAMETTSESCNTILENAIQGMTEVY